MHQLSAPQTLGATQQALSLCCLPFISSPHPAPPPSTSAFYSACVSGPGVAAIERALLHAWRRSWPFHHGSLHFRFPLSLPSFLRVSPLLLRVRLNHTGSVRCCAAAACFLSLVTHESLQVRRAAYRHLLSLISAARTRIWITNAYACSRSCQVFQPLTAALFLRSRQLRGAQRLPHPRAH